MLPARRTARRPELKGSAHEHSMEAARFTLEYTDARTQMRMRERPRLLISADGKTHSLVVSADPPLILASLPADSSEGELWSLAKQNALLARA